MSVAGLSLPSVVGASAANIVPGPGRFPSADLSGVLERNSWVRRTAGDTRIIGNRVPISLSASLGRPWRSDPSPSRKKEGIAIPQICAGTCSTESSRAVLCFPNLYTNHGARTASIPKLPALVSVIVPPVEIHSLPALRP